MIANVVSRQSLPARLRRHLLPRHLLPLVAVALAVLVSGGCAVRLISDYDETIDKTASQLQKDMDSFLTYLETEPDSAVTYGENRMFYTTYATDVRSVKIRAEAHPKNGITIRQYDLMLDSLAELEASHIGDEGFEDEGILPREAIPTYRDLFNQAWGAIIRLEVAKKR